jgi:hypothetical protein
MKVNNVELKKFEEDILPKDKNDKLRWIPTIDDSYFENMGKRGTKKKNIENTYVFSNKSHPVLLVLIHKDAKLATQLEICATQLLKFNSYVLPKNIDLLDETVKERLSSNKSNSSEHIDNFVNMLENIQSIESNKASVLKQSSLEDSDTEDSDEENVKESVDAKKLVDAEESDAAEADAEESDAEESDAEESDAEESDAAENSDSEEQVSCEEILTLKGDSLFYNKITNIVYRPVENSDAENSDAEMSYKEIGFLTEIIKKYSTIYFEENKKYYTVMTDIKHSNGTEYKRCTITNKFFNKK